MGKLANSVVVREADSMSRADLQRTACSPSGRHECERESGIFEPDTAGESG